MKIAFVLPRENNKAIGGFKVVYEYANRLSRRGHEIHIIYNNVSTLEHYKIPKWLKRALIDLRTRIYPKWFTIDSRIKKTSYYGGIYHQDAFDAVFATSVGSVQAVKNAFPNGNLFYMIQDYENWNVTNEYVEETYKCGMHNIVVSNWLKDIVLSITGVEPDVLSNPLDMNVYKRKTSQSERDPYKIGLLYHTNKNKGLEYSFRALEKLKNIYPLLNVEMFGTPRIKEKMPSWIHYTRKATTEQTIAIYNSVSIFMCSSIDEGFGLTGMEAIACGAALASSNYKGVMEYAIDGYNALLSPVKDVDQMVRNVSRLIDDLELRSLLSTNAQKTLKDRSWEKNIIKLERIIKE